MPDMMPRPTRSNAEAVGLKYGSAAGNWQIEVDGQLAFEFSPEDEAEARLAYNQLKRNEPSAKLKRAKEAGDGGVQKSQPSDRIKPSKAAEMLRDGTAHGKPLTEPQRRMLEAAKHKNDKADAGRTGGGHGEWDADAQPQQDTWGEVPRPQPAEDYERDTKLDTPVHSYRIDFNDGSPSRWLMPGAEADLYEYATHPDVAAITEDYKGEHRPLDLKALASRRGKASVQTQQGTTVGVKPGQANPNLPASSVQPTTMDSPPVAPSDPAQASQQGQVGTMEDTNPEGKGRAMAALDQKGEIDVTQIVQSLRNLGIHARVQDAEWWTPEDQQAVVEWIANGGPEPEVLINLHHVQPDHVVGKSGRAKSRKASPASEYLATLKDMAKKVREKPQEAQSFYEGADEAQAKVQEWIESKEQDLATFALERWNEAFDADVIEQAEEHGTIEQFKEELHDLMTELSDVVQEADRAFEAVTNSTDEGGVDEDDWAEHIVTQDALERFLGEFPKKFVDLQEEFYQAIGEWQVEKEEGQNSVWEEQVEEAIEELDSIEDHGQAQQRAEEINEEFRKEGNQYRLVFEGNEWRYNDVETLQEEGYDVKGRRSMRRKSALAGMAKSHRAARRKASPTSFIDTLSTMIEDAGTPAAHQAVDAGFDDAEKFIDQHGKQVVDEKVKAWRNQFGKEAVDHAEDAIGHFKDDVKEALNEIRTAMEVAVNSYKATSAAGTSGDMAAVEDATGDYEAAASELQDLMEQFDQKVEAAAASCERAIMAGRGQLAYESMTEKSSARRRKRDYVAEYEQIKKSRPAQGRKGAAPAGATFPAPKIVPAAPVIYAVVKKSPCCGKGGCACGCNNGRCYSIKYAPGMEALDTDAQRVMDKIEGPRPVGIQLDKGAMSATCILATSGQDREGDIIDVAGVDFTIHKGNPVAMLDHGVYYPLPIGLCRNPGTGAYLVQKNVEAGEITETTYFSQRSEMAEQVYALIDEGIINANSIGFDPVETTPIGGRRQHGKEGPKIVHKANLIEVTWTPLPVNPEAVRAALAKNIAGRPMARAIKSMLVRRVPQAAVRKHWERVGWDNGRDSHAHVGKADGTDEDGAERWQFVEADEASSKEEASAWAADYLGRIEPDAQLTGNVEEMAGYGWQVGYKILPWAEVVTDRIDANDVGDPIEIDRIPSTFIAGKDGQGHTLDLAILMGDYGTQGDVVFSYTVYDDTGRPLDYGEWGPDRDAAQKKGEEKVNLIIQNAYGGNLGTGQGTTPAPQTQATTIELASHVDEDKAVEVGGELFAGKVTGGASVEEMYEAMRQQVLAAAAAPPGSKAEVMKAGDYNPAYGDDIPVKSTGIRVMIRNPKLFFEVPPPGAAGTGAGYWIGRDDDTGERYIRIEWVGVHPDYRGVAGGWLMQRMLDDMVTNGIMNGFGYIGGHAAGEPGNPKLTGYAVWPKYGFDESFKNLTEDAAWLAREGWQDRAKKIQATLKAAKKKFPNAQSILDIFEEDGGDDWWSQNGCEFLRMRFDLEEGSRSRDIFDAYYASKVGTSS